MAVVRPTTEHEQALWARGCARVGGLDEVGRGAACHDLVVCALVLPRREGLLEALEGVRDSKTLSPRQRAKALVRIRETAVAIGIGRATPADIDRDGMAVCLQRAALSAVAACDPAPDGLILDALRLPLDLPQLSFPRADQSSLAVAAASIVAKETRDAEMRVLGERHPGYGLEQNMGYLSPEHIAALRERGPLPFHRRSFLRGVLAGTHEARPDDRTGLDEDLLGTGR